MFFSNNTGNTVVVILFLLLYLACLGTLAIIFLRKFNFRKKEKKKNPKSEFFVKKSPQKE